MRRLYILGAGGFGREVYSWLQALPENGSEWEIAGFLDDNLSALDGFEYRCQVVARISNFQPEPGDLFVCGIGVVAAKRAVCEQLLSRGAEFLSLVHPSAVVGANVSLGRGVVICPQVVLTCDIEIGEFAMINCLSSVGHDAKVGAWATISAHCDLTGFTIVGEGAFLGSGARVIPNKRVGAGVVVGAGSVVIRSVSDNAKVFGVPARQFD